MERSKAFVACSRLQLNSMWLRMNGNELNSNEKGISNQTKGKGRYIYRNEKNESRKEWWLEDRIGPAWEICKTSHDAPIDNQTCKEKIR